MAQYLLQAAYTPNAWAALMKSPHDRIEAVRPVVERLGGSIVNGWFTFGDYDVVMICEMPGNTDAAALAMAISASGAVKAAKTTPLLTIEEGIEALNKAKASEYAPPPTEVPYFGVYRAG